MDKIFRLSANIYQFLLIIIIPLFIIATFLVGAAGHNSEFRTSDYAFFAYIITVLSCLTILKTSNKSSQLKIITRIILMVLILISIFCELYGLYEVYLLYINNSFQFEDNILVGIIILIISLSTTLFIGLLKNKI